MRILALQLKRIGDLVLTAPALAALRRAEPKAHIALAAYGGAAELLSAIPSIDTGIAFGKGRGWAPWQQVLTGGYDTVYDFTGSDRSALATVLASAVHRTTFKWVKKSGVRQLVYNEFVEAPVRDEHTVDHYAALVGQPAVAEPLRIPVATGEKVDRILHSGLGAPFAIVHPGTARAEKYWAAERWSEVIHHLLHRQGLSVAVTGGTDSFESDHLGEIARRTLSEPVPAGRALVFLHGRTDMLTLAGLVARARVVVSCDTAIVHLAAAFERPQVALFGPTNPFHWRPRHRGATVISAAQADAPLTFFEPRMKGAPMDRISTEVVICATDALLAQSTPTH